MFISKKKVLSVVLSVVLALPASSFMIPGRSVSAVTAEQFQVSSGVKYKENKEVINSNKQSIRVLEVNLNDSYTDLDLGIPSPLNSLSTTTTQAKKNHRTGHRVVGAVNGSFFDMTTKVPMYLISKKNVLVNAGIVATGFDQYVNKPVAFGINSQGKALIDYFNLNMTAAHKGTKYKITSMNKIRNYDDLILYTPEYENGYTNTNQYGIEVVFKNASKNRNLEFGDVITGTVSSIRFHGDKKNTKIPENGFVLSAHGTSLPALKAMQIGDEVQISIQIDDKWKNSEFMLASGPMLVNNGKVELGMNPNSTRARERAPRTAVAIDQTMTKVFLVTVDGRQTGYSKGMNLTEFAQYLVKLGAYKALNLDGGGSTTMAVRKHGNEYATLMNRPSDGRERSVSTTLHAISTAPLGEPALIDVSISNPSIPVGSKATVTLKTVLDQFYNPLAKDLSKLKLSSSLGTFNGTTFTATKEGKGTITVAYGNAAKQIPITVTGKPSPFKDIPTNHKYYKELKYLLDKDVIQGYPDGTFRPNATLKRIDAALLLVRALKLDTQNVPDIQFSDVPKNYRFYKEIAALSGANIMKGKEGNRFDPNVPLTRAEMAIILQRGFKLTGSAGMPFTDVPKGSFAYDAISSMYANKITEGYSDKTYRPGEPINRIQYSLFLYRSLQL